MKPPPERGGARSVSGEEEEGVRELRAALRNTRGTHAENQERVSAAWVNLRSASTSSDVQVKAYKRQRKAEKYERNARREKTSKIANTNVNSPAAVEDTVTPLHDAARLGQADRVAELISEGSKVSSKDKAGYSALHWASLYGHAEVVKLLLRSGAGDGRRINRQNEGGNTALHLACLGRHAEVAYMLQIYRPDEHLLNSYEQSPVSLGLRDLIESVKKTRRLDDLQAERSTRKNILSEGLDWRIEVDDIRAGLTDGVASNNGIDANKSFEDHWKRWEDYDREWSAFVQKFAVNSGSLNVARSDDSVPSDLIRYSDVPWPFQDSGGGFDLALVDKPSVTERLLLHKIRAAGPQIRSLIRSERLRWHPDKFLQLFGRRLAVEDRKRIQEGVQDVSQLLNSFASEMTSETFTIHSS